MLSIERNAKCPNKPDESRKFLVLFVLGFFIILAGIIILILTATLFGKDAANFSVLIFIGPIPIVIGYGPEAPWIILLAIILSVLSIMMFLIMRGEMKQKD